MPPETTHYVYLLYSPSKDRYYVGYTGKLADRLRRHQAGYSKSTKSGRPWVLAYLEVHTNSSAAYQRESQIKGKKSRKYLEGLVGDYRFNPFPLPG